MAAVTPSALVKAMVKARNSLLMVFISGGGGVRGVRDGGKYWRGKRAKSNYFCLLGNRRIGFRKRAGLLCHRIPLTVLRNHVAWRSNVRSKQIRWK